MSVSTTVVFNVRSTLRVFSLTTVAMHLPSSRKTKSSSFGRHTDGVLLTMSKVFASVGVNALIAESADTFLGATL